MKVLVMKTKLHFTTNRRKLVWMVIGCLFMLMSNQTNAQTYYNMSSGNLNVNFSDIANWTNGFTSGTGAANFASVGIGGTGSSVTTGIRTTASSATFVTGTTGGIQKGTGALMFLSTGTTSTSQAVAVNLLLNFSGRLAGSLSFDWAAIDNAAGTRPTSMRVFYSLNGTTYSEITVAQVIDKVSPATGTVTVTLPAALHNQPNVRLRFYNYAGNTTSGTGNRDKLQIDNISISSSAAGSTAAVITGDATICNGSPTDINVSITGGTPPYTVVYGDGTYFYTLYNYQSNDPITIYPSTTSSYSILTVADSNNITGIGNSGSADVLVYNFGVNNYGVSASLYVADSATEYFSTACDAIGSIVDEADGNDLGTTDLTSTYSTSNPVGGQFGFTYCKRFFTVTPANNGSATLTFNMSQEDFDDYNSNKPFWMSELPTTETDPVTNIRVTKICGGDFSTGTHKNILLSKSQFAWSGDGFWQLSVLVTDTAAGLYYVTTTPDCNYDSVINLAAGTPTSTSIPITWTGSLGYGWCQIQTKLTSSATWGTPFVTNVGATSAIVSNLASNSQYDIRLRKFCTPTSITPWQTITASTIQIPCSIAPSNIQSNVNGTSATITWSAVSNVGWYGVRYKLSSDSTWITLNTGNTSINLNNLIAGSTYNYQVKTFCNNNFSGTSSNWSTTANFSISSANVIPCSLPPVNIQSTASISNAVITYNAVSNAGWYGIRYKLVSSNTWIQNSSSGVVLTINGLLPNSLYEVQVKTYCISQYAGLSSAWSSSVQFTTAAAICSLPPNGVQVNATSTNAATVSWNSVAGFGWYGVRYKPNSNTTWVTLTTGNTYFNLNNLLANTTYDVEVKTFCNSANAGLSSAWYATQFTTNSTAKPFNASGIAPQVAVYPNPTTDELNIDINLDNNFETMVKIMDMSGRIVKQVETKTAAGMNHIQLNLGLLNSGLYTVMVINNNQFVHVTRVSKN